MRIEGQKFSEKKINVYIPQFETLEYILYDKIFSLDIILHYAACLMTLEYFFSIRLTNVRLYVRGDFDQACVYVSMLCMCI